MYGTYALGMPMVYACAPFPKGYVASVGVLCGAQLINTENDMGIPWAYHGHAMGIQWYAMRRPRAEWVNVNVCPSS